jgi:hypothetical protein|tara:strand:+ start:245 stop:808 length:564 start_codon:yes stop_codon:yes gene_type:complete
VDDSLADRECVFAVVEPREARSTKSVAFLDHCHALQAGAALPRWSDFKLHELPTDIIPYMAVVDVDAPSTSFTYRFWGTGHTALKGVDMTGRKVSDISASAMARMGQRQYEMVVAACRPLIFVHTLTPYNPWKTDIQVAVRVPMSEDGKAIDRVVSYSNYVEDRKTWADIYCRALNAGGEMKMSANS